MLPFISHFPFSQSSLYGEYPSPFFIKRASNACPVLFAVAEEEYSNEPLRRKRIAYFLHKIMRRRVRRRADAPAKETPPYSRDAFARTTLKEECSLLFALSFFAVLTLWRISLPIFHKASNACPVLFCCGGGGYRGANRAAECTLNLFWASLYTRYRSSKTE